MISVIISLIILIGILAIIYELVMIKKGTKSLENTIERVIKERGLEWVVRTARRNNFTKSLVIIYRKYPQASFIE